VFPIQSKLDEFSSSSGGGGGGGGRRRRRRVEDLDYPLDTGFGVGGGE